MVSTAMNEKMIMWGRLSFEWRLGSNVQSKCVVHVAKLSQSAFQAGNPNDIENPPLIFPFMLVYLIYMLYPWRVPLRVRD